MNYVLSDLVDDTAAVRLNLMGQRNNVVGRPFARTQKWGAAPSFAYGLGTDTVWTLQYLHEQEDSIPRLRHPVPVWCARPPSITAPPIPCPSTTASKPMSKW